MQKARFYDRMMFAGTIYQVPFAEAWDGSFTKAIHVAAWVVFFIAASETTVDSKRDFFICTLSLRKEVSRMKILVWEVRTSKGFTLMELSKKSGIGKSTINNIENGKVSPTLFQLEMIAIALGVNITDLFESEYK